MSVLRLAIPSPLRRPFDYLPPEGWEASGIAALQPGVRVRVPFGRRVVTGYLLEVAGSSDVDPAALKRAQAILDPAPLLTPTLMALCLWSAAYYHHPAGEVLNAAFPKVLREGKPHRPPGTPGWRLTGRGRGLPRGALARSPKQAAALALLQENGTVAAALFAERGISAAVLRSLGDKGLAERCNVPPARSHSAAAPGLALNPEQAAAVDAVAATAGGFSCHLLEGVTGSGKTEVYLQLIAACLGRDEQALVLIPEIGLTPQTLARFERRFSANIAVLHSGLGDARRYRAWEAARDGTAQIVIGTRSAVFTPLCRPGLIVVDEEHDASYKQQDGFRYSARDVAIKRAQLENCPVVLGSATPSLESIANALAGRYRHHRLTRRAGQGEMPRIETLDIREQALRSGLAPALVEAVETTLRAGHQVLLFLNRRGYAPTLQCQDCGWLAGCDACDARLTVHRRQGRLRCHHCGASHRLPRQCPQCHGRALVTAGLGTEQSEEFLREHFKTWPVYRVDSDSMQSRDAMQELVEQINRGEPCILLGTQMLTKGHHFPAVALVAVIDTDAMLFSADFRGEERTAQLLTQVAGRAGRSGIPGRVILQTRYPDHPAMRAMLSATYAEQAAILLRGREAAGLPPAGQLVIVRSDCADAACGEQFLQELRAAVESRLPPGAALIGPLPSPMQRRAGKFRSQLLLTAHSRGAAQRAAALLVHAADGMRAAHSRSWRDLKWTIDIDPLEVF
ncbi:MAG: primosomal protein N' [Halioglobus sp.]